MRDRADQFIYPGPDNGHNSLVCWTSIKITVSSQMKSQMFDGMGTLNKGDASRLIGPQKTGSTGVKSMAIVLGMLITAPEIAEMVLTGPFVVAVTCIEAQDMQAGVVCMLLARLGSRSKKLMGLMCNLGKWDPREPL